MAKLNPALKGFTIMETIVAMIIVLVSFGIATGIFVNVRNSQNSTLRFKVLMAMESLAQETLKNGEYLDETYDFGEFRVEKTCTPFEVESDAVLVVFEGYQDNDKKIGERKEIMLPKDI